MATIKPLPRLSYQYVKETDKEEEREANHPTALASPYTSSKYKTKTAKRSLANNIFSGIAVASIIIVAFLLFHVQRSTTSGHIPSLPPSQSSSATNLRFTDNPIVQTGFHPTPVSIVQGGDGNLWFTDNANEIGRVTPNGVITEVPLMNGIGPGPAYPSNIIGSPDKNLWFTMRGKAYIGKFNTNTGSFTYFKLPTQEEGGTGITTGPDGNLWYVVCWKQCDHP